MKFLLNFLTEPYQIKEKIIRDYELALNVLYINRGMDLAAAEKLIKEKEESMRFDSCPINDSKPVMPVLCTECLFGCEFECSFPVFRELYPSGLEKKLNIEVE